MKCPHCEDITLVISERQGIEIDYCPQCRGIWLDRGELDKLIERAAAPTPAPVRPAAPQGRPDYLDSDYPNPHGHKPRRAKSWLSDIFD